MTSVLKIVAVYLDYPHYLKPKEVSKAFKLYKAFCKQKDGSSKRQELRNDLILLLDVLTVGDDRTYKMGWWTDPDSKQVLILQILEPVVSSLFDKPQEI